MSNRCSDAGDRAVIALSFQAWFEELVNGVEDGSIACSEEWGLISKDDL